MAVQTVIQLRRGVSSSWTNTNPTLAQGEFGLETNTSKIKIGDGSLSWASLPYLIKQTDNILLDSNTISATNTNGNLTLSGNGSGQVQIGGNRVATVADLGGSVTSLGTITTGTWNAATVAVLYGGTGATDATAARTNLGVRIGTDVQAYSALLGSVAGATYTGSTSTTTVGTITAGTWTGATIAVLNGGTGATDATVARTNLGVRIGTDVQAYSALLGSVALNTYTGSTSRTTVGTVTTGTWNAATVAVLYGGTGATDATAARTNLGVRIGTDVQSYSALLGSVAGATYTGSTSTTTVGTITSGTWNGANVAVANGGTGANEATTARTNLGVRIGTDVQSYSALLGSVALNTYTGSTSRTTVGTVTTGTWNAATVAVLYGGTGATDATAARTNLGVRIGTDVQAYSALLGSVAGATYTGSTSTTTVGTITSGTWTGGTIAVANGGTFATDATAARTNLGVRIGTDVQAYSALLGSVALNTYTGSTSRTTVGTVTTGTWNAATVAVLYGGTGATDASAARTNLGLAIGINVQAYSALLGSVAGATYAGSTSTTTVGTITAGTWNGGTIAVTNGGTFATDATAARTNLGVRIGTDVQSYSALLGSVALNTYTGSTSRTTVGTVTTGTWNAATVAVLYGGTGATDATAARTNLGVRIGTDVQAYSALLGSVAGATYTGSTSTTTVGTITSGTWTGGTIAVANGGTGATVGSSARTNLGLGTISTQNSNSVSITGGTISGITDLSVSGNLSVTGTTTTINTTNLNITDKNIVLADGNSTDVGADGGGLTLKGTTDKTLNWVDATDCWTSSEGLNLLTGKDYRVNNVSVLTSTVLGSGVVTSSLSTLGTIGTGTWQGAIIGAGYGGTGLATYASGDLLYATASTTLSKLAKGTAYQFLRMNAGATAPEWSNAIDGGTP